MSNYCSLASISVILVSYHCLVREGHVLIVQEGVFILAQEEDVLLAQEEDLFLVQEKDLFVDKKSACTCAPELAPYQTMQGDFVLRTPPPPMQDILLKSNKTQPVRRYKRDHTKI